MSQEMELETFYPHPPERVWQALTDRRALSVWMMDNDFEACLGHQFQFQSCPLPGLKVTIYCQVLEVEAPKRLVYSWKERPWGPASRVSWTLVPAAGGTQVRLRHRTIDAASIPVFGLTLPNRLMGREIDSQFTAPTAISHPLQIAASTSKDGLPRSLEFLNYQTNWHYWLHQKLPGVLTMSSDRQLLQNLYDAFNKREIETIISVMHPDVKWANGLEGGFVYGRDAVREYWTNQFKNIQVQLETLKFETDEKNRNFVTVHQIVKDLQGNLLADMTVKQIFTIENDSLAQPLCKRIVLYEIGETETIQEMIEQTKAANER
ncbi:SRPBCC domain-containing protein [Chamaesiphon sp. VAR_48_metabat_403]|uniref:SRPBCC domain-containing protein n=1 Tax=Chamaesiphon sp. VAR_48_metabat_403 TaxID=2964700 RepID=UPI00286E417B|nr:SRPBCC domain-containing protein [Chamaesiphon sp. VAR_48_metabat_403]